MKNEQRTAWVGKRSPRTLSEPMRVKQTDNRDWRDTESVETRGETGDEPV